MRVSLNWVRQLSGVTLDALELVEIIGSRLGSVETVTDIGSKYSGVLIVKVVEVAKHPNADKLSVCKVDDAHQAKNVKRDSQGLVQVVCGAPNVRAGMKAAWIPPGVVVPSTADEDPFKIEAKELRGIISYGMLASSSELDLGDNHAGLLELEAAARPGADFAVAYGLNDTVIDIENKMLTHRPDCFGILGVAREAAGITHRLFKSPGWYQAASKPAAARGLKVGIDNEVISLVPRFSAIAISGVAIAPSPAWLQADLAKLGIKPINSVVDITNYIMVLTGQPLHAYDSDKLQTGKLGIRLSKNGEQLRLIGGKELKLKAGAVVITDGQKPIGLGGVMGGASTEVDSSTKNIILEAATFDMGLTRQTAYTYGLFTDAATRFTKNQSPWQTTVALSRAAELISQLAGGQAGALADSQGSIAKNRPIEITPNFVNSRLGSNLSAPDIKRYLANVEFKVEGDEKLKVTAPFWRTDIEIAEDLVEEVGRLYGYGQLPAKLPAKTISAGHADELVAFKSRLRNLLGGAGANEILSYSFASLDLLEKAGQASQLAYRLSNPLSPDYEYYRLSLMPSLLDKAHPTIKLGYESFAFYEMGKVHNKLHAKSGAEKVPHEFNHLALFFGASPKAKPNGAAYFTTRAYLDYIAQQLGLQFNYQPMGATGDYQVAKVFEPSRSALVSHEDSGVALGVIGEYTAEINANFKLPKYAAGFEIDIEALRQITPDHLPYRPLNRFPEIEQDICLRLSKKTSFAKAENAILGALTSSAKAKGYGFALQPIDIFEKPKATHRQITWRILLWHSERTLISKEASNVLDAVARSANQKLGAARI